MYLVLKSTFSMGQRINAGDIVELPDDVAKVLLVMGRIEAAPVKPKASPAPSNRSVALEASDAPAVAKHERGKRISSDVPNAASDE